MACLRPCAKAAAEQHIALEMLASPLVLKEMLPHKIHMQMTHLRQLTCMLLIIALIILCFFLEKKNSSIGLGRLCYCASDCDLKHMRGAI